MLHKLLDEIHFPDFEKRVMEKTNLFSGLPISLSDAELVFSILTDQTLYNHKYQFTENLDMTQGDLLALRKVYLDQSHKLIAKDWQNIKESEFNEFNSLKNETDLSLIHDFYMRRSDSKNTYCHNVMKYIESDSCYWLELPGRLRDMSAPEADKSSPEYILDYLKKSYPQSFTYEPSTSLSTLRNLKSTMIIGRIHNAVKNNLDLFPALEREQIADLYREKNLEVIFQEMRRIYAKTP